MKYFTLLLLAGLFIASCGNNMDDKEGNCLTATINGEPFEAEIVTGFAAATTIEYDTLGQQNTESLTINGQIVSLTTGESEIINITFACLEFVSELDHLSTDQECGLGFAYTITNTTEVTTVQTEQGKVIIEEYTGDFIKGTFSFSDENNLGDQVEVTNGFFSTEVLK